MDYNPPDSSVHGISQARVLEWAAISFSRGSSWPRDRTQGLNPGLLHCRQTLLLSEPNLPFPKWNSCFSPSCDWKLSLLTIFPFSDKRHWHQHGYPSVKRSPWFLSLQSIRKFYWYYQSLSKPSPSQRLRHWEVMGLFEWVSNTYASGLAHCTPLSKEQCYHFLIHTWYFLWRLPWWLR